MTELLTESFCERCGTRYTFQAAAPRKGRLSRLRVMSKGLAGYVLNDDTSLEDALAEARSDEDRALSSEQLEAFHKTFNFCMSCRQYTCGNCWNGVEGRCLSCAPDLSREVMPAPFPALEAMGAPADAATAEGIAEAPAAAGLTAAAWPDADLGRGNGHEPFPGALSEPAADDGAIPLERLAVLGLAPEPAVVAGPEAAVEPQAVGEPEAASPSEVLAVAAAEAIAAPEGSAEPEAAVETEEAPAPETVVGPESGAEPEAVAAVEAVTEPVAAVPAKADATPEELAAIAAAQTTALLARFRPGQNLDEVLDQYDAEHAQASGTPAAAEIEAAAVEPADAGPIVAPAVAAAGIVAAEGPEPVTPVPTEPAAAPAEPAPPAPSPEPAAPRRDDRVELPGWRITAPDVAADGAPAPTAPSAPPAAPAPMWPGTPTPVWPPASAPQWPTPAAGTEPQWPTPTAAQLQASAMRARDAMWAASSLEVAQKATGVQSCVSCGLSLSATARFCRRCGTRQG